MRFIDALNELIELGLDGSDWRDRLRHLFQHHEMEDEADDLLFSLEVIKLRDVVSSFARGGEQRHWCGPRNRNIIPYQQLL